MMISLGIGTGKYVGLEVNPSKFEMKEGQSHQFRIRFMPVEGIHVNAQPPLTIKSEVDGVTFRIVKVHASSDYLDPSKPVDIDCTAGRLSPGLHKITFSLGYTFCSDAGKWCRMGNDTLSVDINIKK